MQTLDLSPRAEAPKADLELVITRIFDAPRELVKAELDLFSSDNQSPANVAQALASVPGPSGATDIIWWAFVVAIMATLVYVAVRRRQV